MAGELPNWESELWSYVSAGDGMHCPIYISCEVRQSGGWCPIDNARLLTRLRDIGQFNASKFNLIKGGPSGRVSEMMQRLADKYLSIGKVHCPPVPTELALLAIEGNHLEVHTLPLTACHGAVWCMGRKWVIQLREDDTYAEKRFTIFHEAFHIISQLRVGTTLRKKRVVRHYYIELLADLFASCILMHREWVEQKWVETKNLNKMVEIFNVPKPAMLIRLKRLGLV